MAHKLVSQLNSDGYYVGQVIADESPLEKGVFLIPAGAIDAPVPNIAGDQRAKWNGQNWEIEDILQPQPEPEKPEATPEEIAEAKRLEKQYSYQQESDPLFFKAQRGEATMQDWLVKVEEINQRFAE